MSSQERPVGRSGLAILRAFATAFRVHSLSFAVVLGMLSGGYVVQGATGVRIMHPFLEFSGARLLPMMAIFAVYGVAWAIAVARVRSKSMPEAWRRAGVFSHARLAGVVVGTVLVLAMFDTYGQLKEAIPLLGGWTWDARLSHLDHVLHGTDPWRLLPNDPRTVVAIDYMYGAWFLVLAATLTWYVWQRDNRRVFLAFCLTWLILGVFAAHAFPSAGPCYYKLVVGSDRYQPLLALLDRVRPEPLMARAGQHWLWSLHAAGYATNYTGISAFPSMHVAVPALFALAARRWWSRLFFAAFALMILIGSVGLGWHYAVDGETSLLAVPLIWWLSGRLLVRYPLPHHPGPED